MRKEQILVEESYDRLPGLVEGEKSLFLVYDENVAYLAEDISSRVSLKGALKIEASEQTKCMDTVLGICGFLQEREADRGALVLALGGGVTTDMAGFAASIYKRGVRFATLPTTLLAMVDAAVGGKTGVNYKGLKNILGTFQEPEFVYVNVTCMKTLSHRQFLSGAAELLKTFLISDADRYDKALQELQARNLTKESIKDAIEVKRGVTERDFREAGERRLLNLGHTVGHAIEYCQHEMGLSHGEAVAVGTVCIAKVSERLGIAEDGLSARLAADFESIGLPTECPVEYDDLLEAMRQDKKAAAGVVHCVLLSSVGAPVQKDLAPAELVALLKA